jgi:hypothetical protein
MPYFLGPWFPKREEENCNGLFEASMLALFKPWRTMADLKQENRSFREAFDIFVANTLAETCQIIRNVQFFHECSEGARQCTEADESAVELTQATVWTELNLEMVEGSPEDMDTNSNLFDRLIFEEDIFQVLDQPYSPREQLFAEAAIAIGMEAGVLRGDEYSAAYPQVAPLANKSNLQRFQTWEAVLHSVPDKTTAITPLSEAQDLLSLGELLVSMDVDSEPMAFAIPEQTPLTYNVDVVLN